MVVEERVMPVGYDKRDVYNQALLDLPFREGTGATTQDVAKPGHPVALVNTPTWTPLPSRLMTLNLNGTDEYLEGLAADTVDLDFTSEDYSIGCWVNWAAGDPSQIVIGRYEVDNDGWELYLYDDPNYYLTLRHHHAAGASVRTACNSRGWIQGIWQFIGISRRGDTAIHYRNGIALETTHSVGGLIDPESCNQDLVIGIRYTKNADHFKGGIWRPRVWSRELSGEEWALIFEMERRRFEV